MFCAQVLHPGLVHQVRMDLFLMKIASQFIELLPGLKWLSPTEIVEEFEKLMTQQVGRCSGWSRRLLCLLVFCNLLLVHSARFQKCMFAELPFGAEIILPYCVYV